MIADPSIAIDFGDGIENADCENAEFVLAAPRLWTTFKLMAAPGFEIGQSFIEGRWFLEKGELTDFLSSIRKRAPAAYGAYYAFLSRFKGARHYLRQYVLNKHFTRKVRKHYDVDSQVYERILDEELVYTCAFFDSNHRTLSKAQQNKIATTIRRLDLPTNHPCVLDIGCGWGSTERALVKTHPTASICGLSISKPQIDWARRRDRATLSESEIARIEYGIQDYTFHARFNFYDAVCVIGMLEHVGLGGYNEFFAHVRRFLRPGGTAVIHTIVAPQSGIPTNRWIDRHIFTGGYAPSISELVRAIEGQPLRVSEIYLHPPEHYRRTIGLWISNLKHNRKKMKSYLLREGISSDEADKGIRKWMFYLSGVRNMFRPDEARSHQVAQICMKKV